MVRTDDAAQGGEEAFFGLGRFRFEDDRRVLEGAADITPDGIQTSLQLMNGFFVQCLLRIDLKPGQQGLRDRQTKIAPVQILIGFAKAGITGDEGGTFLLCPDMIGFEAEGALELAILASLKKSRNS